ncbi:MAG: hypothetical protein GF401_00365 [Chitinivibrionales bacterium]|nr:hypothetical protein [Chitinivibrionales bacterium]
MPSPDMPSNAVKYMTWEKLCMLAVTLFSLLQAKPDFQPSQCICNDLDIVLTDSIKPAAPWNSAIKAGISCQYGESSSGETARSGIAWSPYPDSIRARRERSEITYRTGSFDIIEANDGHITEIIDREDRFVYSSSSQNKALNDPPIFHTKTGHIIYKENFMALIEAKSLTSPSLASLRFSALEQRFMFLVDSLMADTSIDIRHNHPFETFRAGSGTSLDGAGDVIMTLTDGAGTGIAGKQIFLYQDTGTTLEDALRYRLSPPSQWLALYATFPRCKRNAYISYGYTNTQGVARINYIENRCIDPTLFAQKLIKHGGVTGSVRAITVNDNSDIVAQRELSMLFEHIAQIVSIRGDGWPDDVAGPEGIISGPGAVRVTRPFGQFGGNFTRKAVEEGFRLRPGDIINLDGGVTIEIAWLNGNRAIARAPEFLRVKNNSIPVTNLNVIILATAYESGFHTRLDKLLSYVSGCTIQRGISMLVSAIPLGEEAQWVGETMVDITKLYEELNISDIDLVGRVRVRSLVLIDTEQDTMGVYTLEGTPAVKLHTGAEQALTQNEMVSFTDSVMLDLSSDVSNRSIIADWQSDIAYMQEEIGKLPIAENQTPTISKQTDFIKIIRYNAGGVSCLITAPKPGEVTASLVSLNGKTVQTTRFRITHRSRHAIWMAPQSGRSLPLGMYILRIAFKGNRSSIVNARKVILQ